VHPELAVHDRARVVRGAHLARAGLVVLRAGLATHRAFPVRVAAERKLFAAGNWRPVQPEAVPETRANIQKTRGGENDHIETEKTGTTDRQPT